MTMNRRALLKGLGAVGVATATGARPVTARSRRPVAEDAVGMLYDATRCIGCKTCMVACRRANHLPYEKPGHPWDDPVDLSGRTKTVIQRYRGQEGQSYVKRQCLHCLDPACVSVCMIGAMHKSEGGIVAYDPDRCIGCRYCQVACPFDVPRFQWDSPTPKIVKCEMCRHLLARGRRPACCEVCPTGAVQFGKRKALLAEAKRRIARHPDRYVPKVYGESDAGGTQVLYLSSVPFEKLGLPHLGTEPVPRLSETVQHGIYKGFIVPAALYVLIGAAVRRHHRQRSVDGRKEET